jgi:hypothetical protein
VRESSAGDPAIARRLLPLASSSPSWVVPKIGTIEFPNFPNSVPPHKLTTQNRKPSHVVLSEGERGLLEAHLHVLCHKLVHVSPVRGVPLHQTQLPTNHNDTAPTTKEKHSVAINSSRRQGGTLATGTRQRTKRIFTNRECHLCGTRFTSQWRTGPTGPSSYPSRLFSPTFVKGGGLLLPCQEVDSQPKCTHTHTHNTPPPLPARLCNACGIRHARQVKQERARQSQPRKTSAVSTLDGVCSPSWPRALVALCEVALDTGVDTEILEAMLAEYDCLCQHIAMITTSHQRTLLLATRSNPILTRLCTGTPEQTLGRRRRRARRRGLGRRGR